jgi:tetratricopeptide (TPR) repeat protein
MTAPHAAPDREQRLDEVLAAYLNAARRGAAPPRKQLLDSHPDLADDLREFFRDQDHFDRLATPLRAAAPAALGAGAALAEALGGGLLTPPREFGDYAELEEIARGGMGVVFRARQKSLNRRVALKMLLAGPLATADDVRRFRTEAEAAASLSHPNIVPIHEVGAHGGFPYLSMQFLEGGSLAEAAGRPPWLVEGRASARRVARVLVDVAWAVHHAHQRGILHRDLKPANILLDAAGKAHVSDFGLAKRSPALSWDRPTVTPGAAAGGPTPPAATHTGAILGTPAYMAPEQASGDRGAVTVRTDVYGLGAILYEMLTGRAPFRGATAVETMRLVLEREPVAPSRLNAWVDRDLETICLKCLHKQPGRRYAGADELARDLERYLNGEPIQARPVGALERAWRWCKRQPAVAALTLALLVTLTAAVPVFALLWLRAEWHADRADAERAAAEKARSDAERAFQAAEERRVALEAAQKGLEEKRAEAEKARAEADDSFRRAHSFAVNYSTRILDELKQSPGLQPVQKRVLEETLAYLEQFVEDHGHDPALRRELADTLANIAHITAAIGSPRKAEASLAQALAIYRDLHERDPVDLALRREVAGTLSNLAVRRSGPRQLATLTEALRAYEEFLRDAPDDGPLLKGLANTLHNFAVYHGNTGRPKEALEYYARAADIQLALLRRHPDADLVQAALAATFANVCVEQSRRPGEVGAALCALHHARLLREDLARRFPRDPGRRADVLGTLHSEGIILRDRSRLDEARPVLEQALAGRGKLADENPSVIRFQLEVADTRHHLGVLHEKRDDRDAARKEFEQARDVYIRLARRDPDNPLYPKLIGCAWFDISCTYGAQKKRPEERDALEKSHEYLEPLADAAPDNADYRHQLARTLNNLGLVLGRLNRRDDAVAALKRGAAHARAALESAPHIAAYRETLNANLGTLGEVERFYNHPDAAVAATLERRALWPDNAPELYRVAADLGRAAALAAGRDRDRYADLTLETLRQARAAGFSDADRLRQDSAFDVLRGRNDFARLLDELVQQRRPDSPE